MMNRTLIDPDDREFLAILAGCAAAYALAVALLALVPMPTRSTTDVTSLPPRIAKLILEAPAPAVRPVPLPPAPAPTIAEPPAESPAAKPEPAIPKATTPKVEEAPPAAPPPVVMEEAPPIDTAAALQEARLRLEAEAAARREQNRAVAKQSGLLKALGGSAGGPGLGQAPTLDKVLSDVSVLSNPALTPGTSGRGSALGGGAGTGSGEGRLSVDDIVSGIKGQGTGETVILAGKTDAHADSSLVIDEISAKRNDASVYAMFKTLDPWLKLKYHAALRERPDLGNVVSIRFTITAQGDVLNCHIGESQLQYPPLEEAILKRACLLKFPPLKEGVGEDVDVTYTIDFARFLS